MQKCNIFRETKNWKIWKFFQWNQRPGVGWNKPKTWSRVEYGLKWVNSKYYKPKSRSSAKVRILFSPRWLNMYKLATCTCTCYMYMYLLHVQATLKNSKLINLDNTNRTEDMIKTNLANHNWKHQETKTSRIRLSKFQDQKIYE